MDKKPCTNEVTAARLTDPLTAQRRADGRRQTFQPDVVRGNLSVNRREDGIMFELPPIDVYFSSDPNPGPSIYLTISEINLPEETVSCYSLRIVVSILVMSRETLSTTSRFNLAFSRACNRFASARFRSAIIAIICGSVVLIDALTSAIIVFSNDSIWRTCSGVAEPLTCTSLPNTLNRCKESTEAKTLPSCREWRRSGA